MKCVNIYTNKENNEYTNFPIDTQIYEEIFNYSLEYEPGY